MFKITNEQLIQIAAVDAGMDPFAEYCTKGVYAANGYKVRAGEKPALSIELWCPRIRKDSVDSQSLSNSGTQQDGEKPGTSVPSMFFQFKKCHLFSRAQVVETKKPAKDQESSKVMSQGELFGIAI